MTIYDVAERAGVAISTVSRVLNDSPHVAAATRDRVLETIDALKFRPHRLAKALAQQRSQSIAIAIPTFTTPFHNELLAGVRSILAYEDRELLLFDLGTKSPLERLLRKLEAGTVDGLLLAGVPVDQALAKELKALRAPVVLVGHHHTEFDCYYWDNASGAYAATAHLVSKGHRRIGMIRAYTDGYLQTQRIEGYKKALSDGGLPIAQELIQSGSTPLHAGFSEEHGFEAMQRILALNPPVTAVFSSSDVQAIGAWKALREAGKRVPEDVALVGYDDLKTSAYVGLSSVAQDMVATGELAAKRLLFRLDNPGTTDREDHQIVPRLKARLSSSHSLNRPPMSIDTHREAIQQQLNHTIGGTDFTHLGKKYQGKVRDTYQSGDRLILVTTDRISAFDQVLRQSIPFKGQVLNQLAAYFFEATSDIVANHIVSVPDPNVTVALRCEPTSLEFVVRGYLVGHAWRTYRSGKRVLCGKTLPNGLRQNDRLPKPILTPTTKAQEGHDEDISREEAIAQGLITAALFDQLEAYSLALFERGSQLAASQGLILVDTKYEFGRAPDGTYVLIDEVHTPDSSRYFYLEPFEGLQRMGKPQQQLSKEFVREWLMSRDFQGQEGQTLPDLPDDFRAQVSARYIALYESVTGKAFEPDMHPDPAARMRKSLSRVP